ncbi:D-2-hydroxyacid dehydrogenase family protein [Siccirubricoccus sp. KC 17139]|uniref:D-2-hydroxyacid dehydrogenase family protein n=1 Tax=Siccirubricoccus soli TaxID=2899147 RepID=A0ABT1D952_9PROT|nr:D-2-hydroxyacid dehydrogenase family protein [Siccirubricoccus soli]MCO6417719.1 D-2-hydroxyacid dehydrogenase family protein [Siccirubricoccus soli]MCP2683854.1 D-2-hydroxyacid dehydrogenase family protein [Siccirubricoccus soli]
MPSLTRLAILDDYQGVARSLGPWDRLPKDIAIEVFRDTITDQDALAARLAPFDALLIMRERTPFPKSLLDRLPNLKLLITTGARNRSVDVAAATARGITVCGTPGFGNPTVDITWGLILSVLRHIPEQEAALRAGKWQVKLGTGLEGKTLGVIGLGNLGSRVAKVGAAFGMQILGWSQNLTAEKAAAAGATLAASKEALLEQADVVTLHVVLSDRSRGMIGAAELARMKRSAIIVNTSRGPLIDQAALIAALQEGRIAGAGIDVYDQEPLPANHPILSAPNTVLTPHLGYVTEESYRAYYLGAIEAIEAYLKGTPIRELRAE